MEPETREFSYGSPLFKSGSGCGGSLFLSQRKTKIRERREARFLRYIGSEQQND